MLNVGDTEVYFLGRRFHMPLLLLPLPLSLSLSALFHVYKLACTGRAEFRFTT